MCSACGKEIPSRAPFIQYDGGIYCSRKCYGVARSNKVDRKCEACGRSFLAPMYKVKEGKARFCSKKCQFHNGVDRKCEACGSVFHTTQRRINMGNGKYCSRKCSHDARKTRVLHKCKTCQKLFPVFKYTDVNGDGKYCSHECQFKDEEFLKTLRGTNHPMYGRSGAAAPNWRGGVSFEPYCPRFNEEFRERVREYWGRKCILCGRTEADEGHKLHVHHVHYDKLTCCNDTVPLFAPLCQRHHSITTGSKDREGWALFFVRLIGDLSGGSMECYLPRPGSSLV